jgi:hypothetical protein
LTLTAYPCKLSADLLEARLEGYPLPRPEQVLCLNNADEPYAEAIYCQVDWVALPEDGSPTENCCRVGLKVLHGSASMSISQALILEDAQIAQVAHALQVPLAHPLTIGEEDFSSGSAVDFFRLGPLTLVEGGSDSTSRVSALMQLLRAIQPYQRILVLDPLGLAMPSQDVAHFEAGHDWQLALQQVGSKRFLDAFAETLPDLLREAGLRTVASLLPQSSGNHFVGFKSLFALEILTEAPLRNLILQTFHTLGEANVFAETTDQVMDFGQTAHSPITVLDLSGLPDPWKGFFYTEVCHRALKDASGELALALIHPEIYLPNWPQWIRQATEQELNFLAVPLPSPRQPGRRVEQKEVSANPENNWKALASNVFQVSHDGSSAVLQGALTLGLPLRYSLKQAAFSSLQQETALQPIHQQAAFPNPFADIEEKPNLAMLVQPRPSEIEDEPNSSEEEPAEESELPVQSDPIEYSSPEGSESTPAAEPKEEEITVEPPPLLLPAAPISQAEETKTTSETEDNHFTPTNEQEEEKEEEEDSSPQKHSALADIDDFPLIFAEEEAIKDIQLSGDSAEQIELWDTSQERPEDNSTSYSNDEPTNDEFNFDFDATLFQPEWQAPPARQTPSSLLETHNTSHALIEPNLHLDNDQAFYDENRQGAQESTTQELDAHNNETVESPSESTAPPLPDEDEHPPVLTRSVAPQIPAGYSVGERVRHQQYGPGTIMKILPMAEQVILNITFEQVGKRLLDPSLCQLTREADEL